MFGIATNDQSGSAAIQGRTARRERLRATRQGTPPEKESVENDTRILAPAGGCEIMRSRRENTNQLSIDSLHGRSAPHEAGGAPLQSLAVLLHKRGPVLLSFADVSGEVRVEHLQNL